MNDDLLRDRYKHVQPARFAAEPKTPTAFGDLAPAATRVVTIPAREQHDGFSAVTARLPWTCLECGEPRGEPFETTSYDGSRRLACHGWTNPCGHVEKYSAVRASMERSAA